MEIADKLSEPKRQHNTLLTEYVKERNRNGKIILANQVMNTVGVGSGATAITTAITVVGLPVAVVTGVISGLCSITSIVLSQVSKSGAKRLEKKVGKLNELRNAIHKIEMIMVNDEKKLLTRRDFEEATALYNKVTTIELQPVPSTESTPLPV